MNASRTTFSQVLNLLIHFVIRLGQFMLKNGLPGRDNVITKSRDKNQKNHSSIYASIISNRS